MATTDSSSSYNKYTELPKLSYNCITKLMDGEEMLWKLLYYPDEDAWKKGNLTTKEKRNLIYAGQPDQTKYRVFMDLGQDTAWTVQGCILRICPVEILPSNYVYGQVVMGFEVYCHYRINHLSNYQTRISMVAQRLIENFNGEEVGGLGRLFFDSSVHIKAKTEDTGQVPFKGERILMCNWLGG